MHHIKGIILDNIFINNKNNKLLNNYALHFSCIKIIKNKIRKIFKNE